MREYRQLIDKYLGIVDSPRNRNNSSYWENSNEPYLIERWRGRSLRKRNAPFTMALDIMGYAKILDFACDEYYNKGEEQLYNQLRYALWEYENLYCHRYFENAVFVATGHVFEASLFGANIHYLKSAGPWVDEKEHVIEKKSDLLKIKAFDFYKTGLCEVIHTIYHFMKNQTAGYGLHVMFPVAYRSPFSTAIMVRGFNELLMDLIDDPAFVKDLMRVITDYLKEYATKRAKFLGQPIPQCYLFNDEISTPMISNDIYRSLILPYEIELSEHCNGVRYWHSCGVTDQFYESVSTLKGLRMMHVGPWSELERAVDVFSKKDITLEICVTAVRDVYQATEAEMREKLQFIKDRCDGKVRYSVRADGFGIMDTVEGDLKKIRVWNKVASEIFPG